MGTLPPARRPVDLRHARPDGAAVLAALPARRRAGQLREPRRRPGCGHALHRVPPVADRDGDAPRHPLRHGRLQAELRRVDARAGGLAGPVPEPPRERLGRDRRRHGDQHATAPARRGDRRRRGAHRQARGERRRPDAPHHGPRLPDGCDHRRPRRDPRRLSDGPRPHRHARARPHRGAARRQDGDHRHRAALRGQEGRRLGRDHEDRRPLQGEGPHRDLGRRGLLGQVGDADPDRPQARGRSRRSSSTSSTSTRRSRRPSATTRSRSSTACRGRSRCSSWSRTTSTTSARSSSAARSTSSARPTDAPTSSTGTSLRSTTSTR